MLSLNWKRVVGRSYPNNNFPKQNTYWNITRRNIQQFEDYLSRTNFVQDLSADIPSLIIRALGIDPEWDLEFLIDYTRMRTSSIASMLGLAGMTYGGDIQLDKYYSSGCYEVWCVMDDEHIRDDYSLDNITPIVPLYSTILTRDYQPQAIRESRLNPHADKTNDFAVIGVNFVELAVGWWLYLRSERDFNLGLVGYLNKHVYNKAALIQNQLVVVNILYEYYVNKTSLEDVIQLTPQHNFTVFKDDRLFRELIDFAIYNLDRNRLVNFEHLLIKIPRIFPPSAGDYTNYYEGGIFTMLVQSSWVWQIPLIKLYSIYLAVGNENGYRASDINNDIRRVKPNLVRNYRRLTNKFFKQHLEEITLKLLELNDDNSL